MNISMCFTHKIASSYFPLNSQTAVFAYGLKIINVGSDVLNRLLLVLLVLVPTMDAVGWSSLASWCMAFMHLHVSIL